MAYRLRDNLYWCVCGGRVIFLDVDEDRYFCLSRAAEAAFVRLADGEAEAGDREALHALLERGFLIDDPASPGLRSARPLEPARRDMLQQPCPPPGVLDVLGAFAAETRAAWLLRRRPFVQILDGVRKDPAHRRRHPRTVGERLRRIVSASMAVSLVLRASDRCLVRALAVQSTCRRYGIDSMLVFGVRMNPFGAHCWVQLGEMVLVGDYEQVRLFTPIAALR